MPPFKFELRVEWVYDNERPFIRKVSLQKRVRDSIKSDMDSDRLRRMLRNGRVFHIQVHTKNDVTRAFQYHLVSYDDSDTVVKIKVRVGSEYSPEF